MTVARDARLIYAAALLRSTAAGILGVTLAIFFAERGQSVSQIGLIIGVGLAGAAILTLGIAPIERRLGARGSLMGLAIASAAGCVAAALFTSLVVLLPFAFAGMLNGMGRDRGPAGALEQALLPDVVEAKNRTWTLAWYNVVLDAGHALGALAATLPTLLMIRGG